MNINILLPSGLQEPRIYTVGQDSVHDMAHCVIWYVLPTSSHHPTIFCLHTEVLQHKGMCLMYGPPTHRRSVLPSARFSPMHSPFSQLFFQKGHSLSSLALLPSHTWYLDSAMTITVPGQSSVQMWGKQQSSFQDALQPHAAVIRLEHLNSKLSNWTHIKIAADSVTK